MSLRTFLRSVRKRRHVPIVDLRALHLTQDQADGVEALLGIERANYEEMVQRCEIAQAIVRELEEVIQACADDGSEIARTFLRAREG